MSDAPERIAFRWEVGAAITSGPLMNHPDYVHYVRADRIEELEAKLERAENLLIDAMVQLENGKIKTRRNRAYLIGRFLAKLKGETND